MRMMAGASLESENRPGEGRGWEVPGDSHPALLIPRPAGIAERSRNAVCACRSSGS